MDTRFRITFMHKDGDRRAWWFGTPPTLDKIEEALKRVAKAYDGNGNVGDWVVVHLEATFIHKAEQGIDGRQTNDKDYDYSQCYFIGYVLLYYSRVIVALVSWGLK